MRLKINPQRDAGFSLSLVMILVGVLLLLVSGVLVWTTSSSVLTQRYNEYYDSVAAAEAATEKVVANIARDFQSSGVSGVDANLGNYRTYIPTAAEAGEWGNYQFNDPSGIQNATYVTKLTAWQYSDLNWKYSGFKGSNSIYRVISNARDTASRYNITSAVRQEIQIASIPLFEFAAFYALDMEICPGTSDMAITGRVHCNSTIYCQPASPRTLTFADHVTAAQKILHAASPNDPSSRTPGTIVYQGEHDWNASSLNLPFGGSTNLHSLIEIPPPSESPTSLMGLQRYYNKADLIILVSNTTAVAKSGAYNNFATTVPWTNVAPFVNTNISFCNKRESPACTKTILATQVDLQQFQNSYGYLNGVLGHSVKILYVADLRSQSSSMESGVRLINGKALPANGLTVATLNPLYVIGHFNAPDSVLGTTSTTGTVPASLISDAITLLSDAWRDNNSGSGVSARNASDTTVNAAVLTGIVPSGNGYYSGGLENYFRLLESWGSHTLTFNGSMVALFPSQIATAPWGTPDVYTTPNRVFSFDVNFKDNTKLPPGTPNVRTIIRAAWNIAQANSTQ